MICKYKDFDLHVFVPNLFLFQAIQLILFKWMYQALPYEFVDTQLFLTYKNDISYGSF